MNIVFFDGYCSICNGAVDWLIKNDKKAELKFASLQGETARKMLGEKQNPIDADTVIYLRENESFEQSTAVLKILIDLGGTWSVAKIFLAIPKPLRDLAYKLIAKNRYRILKKRETCRVPTAEERTRLLP